MKKLRVGGLLWDVGLWGWAAPRLLSRGPKLLIKRDRVARLARFLFL